MKDPRPYCLSIAGFDPSGGAGVLADIKTFEANKVNGMAVVTGLTFQNDSEFDGVEWVETEQILKQIEVLLRKFHFEFVKIGMIRDLPTLNTIVSYLTSHISYLPSQISSPLSHISNLKSQISHLKSQISHLPPPISHPPSQISNLKSQISNLKSQISNIKIIWDPIVKTSSGFNIQKNLSIDTVAEICKKIYLITPNIDEIRILMKQEDKKLAGTELSRYCNVYLKGGHSETNLGRDFLFPCDSVSANNSEKELKGLPSGASKIDEVRQENEKESSYPANGPTSRRDVSPLSFGEGKGVRSFRPKKISSFPKHGSGCVLSSAITANLAKGESLLRSCLKGKNYITEFLMSNKTLLGYHKI